MKLIPSAIPKNKSIREKLFKTHPPYNITLRRLFSNITSFFGAQVKKINKLQTWCRNNENLLLLSEFKESYINSRSIIEGYTVKFKKHLNKKLFTIIKQALRDDKSAESRMLLSLQLNFWSYLEPALDIDYLFKIFNSDAPKHIQFFAGARHANNISNFLIKEGYQIIYDTGIRLKTKVDKL